METEDGKTVETLHIPIGTKEPESQQLARTVVEPELRHALIARAFATFGVSSKVDTTVRDYSRVLESVGDAAANGELALVSRTFISQALTCDTMFTEFARRAAMNVGRYPDAAERFARIALKAQANSRATLEALAKLHQPREQTVRHVHVNEGGQAIVADQFNHYSPGAGNAGTANQSHATGATGARATLPSPDPEGHAMPFPIGAGQAALPDARRNKPRRAKGQ